MQKEKKEKNLTTKQIWLKWIKFLPFFLTQQNTLLEIPSPVTTKVKKSSSLIQFDFSLLTKGQDLVNEIYL